MASAASWDNQWVQIYGPQQAVTDASGGSPDQPVVYMFSWDGAGYRAGNWWPQQNREMAGDQPPAPQSNPTVVTPSRPEFTPQPAAQSNSSQAVSGLSAEEQQAFNLLNADRAANGLAPLRLNSQLVGLAEYYAQDMINRHFFSHNNPEGQTPFDRMRQRGISFGYAGENLAINSSVSAAEQAFMNSAGHRANILNSHYTQVGVGVRHSSQGGVYVVQEFTDG